MIERVCTRHTHFLRGPQLVYVEPICGRCLLTKRAASHKFMRAKRCESGADDCNTRAARGWTTCRVGKLDLRSVRDVYGSESISGKLRVATRSSNAKCTLWFTSGRHALK